MADKFTFYFILFYCSFFNSQTFELKNENLIKYYKLTNAAERKILINDLKEANQLYKNAFIIFKKPHARDLYNSMKVALKVNDIETAHSNYHFLKCLGQYFDNDFYTKNFTKSKKHTNVICERTIDIKFKKSIDSLYDIDQYYRKLSKGDYSLYRKELTLNDSITSSKLIKLIKNKGFPNEYNIGLGSANEMFYQKFYYIIWHQLASNRYSPQQVNFSEEIEKALNIGKICPDIAGQLLDLNNGTTNYSYFKIYQFISNNGLIDCCYTQKDFLPQNRNDDSETKIKYINKQRELIGLSSSEDELIKNVFYLNNKEYVFGSHTIEGLNFENDKDVDKFKKLMIKINDITY